MRSALYVPGDSPEKLARALGRGADALIVDLEDAVPPGDQGLSRVPRHGDALNVKVS